MSQEDGIKELRDIDLQLKDALVRTWEKVVDSYIAAKYGETFRGLKTMFVHVASYDFSSRQYLGELIETLDNYINSLGGKPITTRQELEFLRRKTTFLALLEDLLREIPRAFIEKGLWFREVKQFVDSEEQFNIETFGEKHSSYETYIKELSKLEVKELLKLFGRNQIIDAYSRAVRLNVL